MIIANNTCRLWILKKEENAGMLWNARNARNARMLECWNAGMPGIAGMLWNADEDAKPKLE